MANVKENLTHTEAGKSHIILVKNTRNNDIIRAVFPESVQIGLSEKPEELVLTGRLGLTSRNIVPSRTSIHTLLTNDDVIVFSKGSGVAGSAYIDLPKKPRIGQLISIKDSSGVAATENVVISSTETTIDGADSTTISSNYGIVTLIFNGIEWNLF